MKPHPSAPVAASLAGLALGLILTTLWSEEAERPSLPTVAELQPIEVLEDVRVLPRTALALAMEEARSSLEAGRPWTAWTALREHVDAPAEATPSAVLLAARAAGDWGGWSQVVRLLEGREWLDGEADAEGWFLLGRAHEEKERWESAAAAYREYAARASGHARGVARARLGRTLLEADREREAAAAFRSAAWDLPEVADWMRALESEAYAAAGDPTLVSMPPEPRGSAPVRLRRARAEARGWLARGDTTRALGRLEQEAVVLGRMSAGAELGEIALQRARLLAARGRTRDVHEVLRAAAWNATAPGRIRAEAASLMGDIGGIRSVGDELARAAAWEAAEKPGLAARALGAAIDAGAPDAAALRFRRGMLLWEARDFGPARSALLQAAAQASDPARVAEAELHAARAAFRRGQRAEGLAELRRLVAARPGTPAAGSAAFVLGDASVNRGQAIEWYRRAAAIPASPDAREALFRVGDRSLKAGDSGAAFSAWEEYVRRYPTGDETARVGYRAGVLHERAGREAAARNMYTAAIAADPVSYHAVRAAERLGVAPLRGALRDPRPWVGLSTDFQEAREVLARLRVLEEAGLEEAWKEELDAASRRFEGRSAALLVVAEGVRDSGHTVEGIRLGWRLFDARGKVWDERLLRVVFPLQYRELLMAEADRADVDPMFLAALVRQESSFNPEARSWVGATGLGQIMPSTGRWLAPSAGLEPGDYQEQLLRVPEVNLRMGARYLADLIDRYDGARDLALAGYNAGPGRADRWRRELGHARDVDAFRERIPFDETRHYVQVVLRNAAVYEWLYGKDRSPGLISGE